MVLRTWGMARPVTDARERIQAEIDGVREAIRLKWQEMERSTLSRVDRNAIRANVARLVQTLQVLLTLPAMSE